MRKIIISLLLITLCLTGFSQFNVTYKKYYTIAEDYTFVDNYTDALPYFLKLDSLVPNNANIQFQIGMCYLLAKKNNEMAISYLEKATPYISTEYYGRFNETSAPVFTYYYLGVAYQEINAFDKSIENYSRFKYYLTNEDVDLMKDVNRKIEQVYTAKRYYSNPIRTRTINMGEAVNTEFAEYAPVVAPDLSYLIFTSRRPGSTGGKKDLTGQPYEDIYIADYDVKTETLSNVRKAEGEVNSDGHEASISVSWDGNTLFIYKDDKGDGNIYMSTKIAGSWGPSVKMPAPINTKHYENHAFLSPDGNQLYFVSNRPGGLGGKDIWVSKKNGEKWEEPVNMGSRINTPYNEDSPVLLSDGKTLYFSSQGHENMGGYDIFVTTFDNGQWSTPVNLAYPINTSADDVFFVPTLDGTQAYFSTIRENGFGNQDIYKLVITEPLDLMAMVNGIVKDTTNNKIIIANIDVWDKTMNQLIVQTSNNSESGEYSFTVPVGRSYEIRFETAQGLVIVDNFTIPNITSENLTFYRPYYLLEQPELVQLDTLIKNVNVGQRMGDRFVLRNVHFDFDKATLRKESETELNLLVKFLKDYPDVKIEIMGHTDDKGSATYNQKLSEDRSLAVTQYLVAHGISMDRLQYKGYGFTQPIASNETDMGRQLNRRVEFRIMGTGTFENIPYDIASMQVTPDPIIINHRGDQNADSGNVKSYYIIGGSFSFLKNAERAKDNYVMRGFKETEILGLNSVGTFRVSLKKFATKDEALKDLPKLRKALNDESIWILEY